ncbi:MAG: mechanosensitive ion channel [Candidatus Melainabacteria bacterium]|nr:mechanosensitive ion channel [Candidatus Melainabacteria bacterium]
MTRISRLKVYTSLIALMFSYFLSSPVFADSPSAQENQGAAVVVNGKRLFVFYSSFDGRSPLERAERTSNILRQLSEEPDFDINSIETLETAQGTDIMSGTKRIATVCGEDARIAQSSSSKLSRDFAAKIRYALAQRIEKVNAGSIATAIGLTAICTIILIFVVALVSRLTTSLFIKLKSWRGHYIKAIKIQQAELIGEHALYELVVSLVRFGQIALIIIILIGYILQCLSFFPGTRHLTKAIIANAIAPLHAFVDGVIDFIPETLALIGIIVIAYLVNGFAHFIFNALEDSTIRIADFDPDWAEPTYKLVRGLIFVIAIMVALPYLPGWGSPAFNQVGLLLGLLVSLGSTGVVGNVMAGTVLTYTNAFKLGDRVKIGDCTGDVVEKTLFVTRLKTPKNEVVSIPNAQILNTNVMNYSVNARTGTLTVYTSVTIGYESPYEQIQDLLINAALECPGIEKDPKPFVLQTSLDDYYITYEINAFTKLASELPRVYSDLHLKILDKFNEAQVEIMSPQYICLRDGNLTSIPLNYMPKDYKQPPFVVDLTKSNPNS